MLILERLNNEFGSAVDAAGLDCVFSSCRCVPAPDRVPPCLFRFYINDGEPAPR